MSEIKVNKISPKQLCTQLTLGDSGDTIIIPSGATIQNCGTATGFGRTGTVNWDTTVKTTGFTAVNGTGYFCNTTSGAFTVTLPATPTAGNIVAFKDYAKTWNTNNLTIGRNGSNIEGSAGNSVQNTQGQSITLIYVDSTKGWVIVDSAQYSELNQPQYVAATGGTVLTCGDYKTHVFTSSGCFVVSSVGNSVGSNSVEYLVVAGGGAGGTRHAGGGGAGGYRTNYPSPTTAGLPVSATTYPITVGAGAPSTSPGNAGTGGTQGSNSIFSTITSSGGGGGSGSPSGVGTTGGSGGGGTYGSPGLGFAGNTPPVSPPQGNPGGNGNVNYNGAGGGGAGAAGSNGTPSGGAAGGVGSYWPNSAFGPTSSSYGSPGPVANTRYFAGGGGGGSFFGQGTPGPGGAGGSGGGGTGGAGPVNSVAGTTNTGGGGGGGGTDDSVPSSGNGGAGGSGIVIIRYKYQ